MISPAALNPLAPRRTGPSAPRSGLRIRAEQAAAELPPLMVAAERVAATVAQGIHGRRRAGQGETFWQFRQYQPGETARIDWRESAKSQHLYIRETEWEAAQSVWLWRDGSGSMNYSSAEYVAGGSWPTKRDRAELLLAALASLLVRGGERVALQGSGRAPLSGHAALTRIVELLEQGERAAAGVPGLPEFEPIPRAAQLVWIGDFLAPLTTVNAAVARFAGAGVKGHMLQIADPAEEDLPFAGRVRFEGVEEPEALLVSRVETLRGDYAERYRAHRDGLAAIARSVGWTIGFHRTDRPPHLALLSLHAALAAERRR